MADFRTHKQFPDPWLLYLLIDPTLSPSSHPQGEIFYVGVAPGSKSRAGAQGLRSVDLASAKMLPVYEKAARQRIEELDARGVLPLVEVIVSGWAWDVSKGDGRTEDISPEEIERLKGVVVETLCPRPLNTPRGSAGVVAQAGRLDRLPGWLLDAARDAGAAPVPSEWLTLGVLADVPMWFVAETSPDELFDVMVERLKGTFPKGLAALVEEEGSALLLATASWLVCPTVIPEGFIFGVWEVDGITPGDDGQIVCHRVPDTPEVEALRRALLWKTVPMPQSASTVMFEVTGSSKT